MTIDFSKGDGLVPVVIQDIQSLEVLMLGYMNEEAYNKTVSENKVTFSPARRSVSGQKAKKAGIFCMLKVSASTAIMILY